MLGSRLFILHLLIAVLLATPAVCCGQTAVAAADLPPVGPGIEADHCPGHARAATAAAAHGLEADDCAGCALLAAVPNPEDLTVVADEGQDVSGPAAAAPPVLGAPPSGAWTPPSGAPPAAGDTPVTRFDRLLIPG